MTDFADFLNQEDLILFAGAMGTELQRRGYKTKLPLWSAQANLDAFDLVKEIHTDYFKAGSDICITNTFRTTPRAFAKVGREDEAHEAMRQSVKAARDAQKTVKDHPTFIAGSFTTLEDCYEPDLVPSAPELEEEHTVLASWLAEENVDLLLAETINSKCEAKAMAQAASNTGLPFLMSFVVDSSGNLLDGSPLSETIVATDFAGRCGILLNCRPIDVLDSAFKSLSSSYDGPIGLYPNGFGHPHDDLGWKFEDNDDSIEKFVEIALKWHDSGAKILGGCCGTTPKYIEALAKATGKNFTRPSVKAA